MCSFDIVAEIQHDAGKKVKYQREANRNKGNVDEKQAYFADRNMETFAQIRANAKRITFKKC